MKSIALQMTKIYMKELETLRVVEGGEAEGGGSGTHKVYGENMHRAKKWNNFANIWTIDLIFVSLCS